MAALPIVALTLIASAAAQPAVSPPRSAPRDDKARLAAALERFDFGDYEAVVAELASLVEQGATVLPRADRMEALRAYGIACVLVGRQTAAEGAFLLLLEADPRARLDPHVVRPEAVAVFEAVRARAREQVLQVYRKARGRRFAVLNLLPPAGQLQNRQYAKGYALLGVELGLLALNITSGALLYRWRGDTQDFPGHEGDARVLRPVNWVSFGVLASVIIYGICDGFVVGHRRTVEERAVERDLRAASPGRGPRPTLALEQGLGVHF